MFSLLPPVTRPSLCRRRWNFRTCPADYSFIVIVGGLHYLHDAISSNRVCMGMRLDGLTDELQAQLLQHISSSFLISIGKTTVGIGSL